MATIVNPYPTIAGDCLVKQTYTGLKTVVYRALKITKTSAEPLKIVIMKLLPPKSDNLPDWFRFRHQYANPLNLFMWICLCLLKALMLQQPAATTRKVLL